MNAYRWLSSWVLSSRRVWGSSKDFFLLEHCIMSCNTINQCSSRIIIIIISFRIIISIISFKIIISFRIIISISQSSCRIIIIISISQSSIRIITLIISIIQSSFRIIIIISMSQCSCRIIIIIISISQCSFTIISVISISQYSFRIGYKSGLPDLVGTLLYVSAGLF